MINFWKLTCKLVKEQRDQFKTENEKLRERNKKLEKRNNQKVRRYLRGGLQQMRIEDLESKYNGMISENEKLKEEVEHLNGIIKDEEDWKLLELEQRWE